MRVLLLNPPGSHNYIRDYFCSKRSKSYYRSAPAALLMLSGQVGIQHEIKVLDAIAERLSVAEALSICAAFSPDAVIALVGAASWDEDRAFLLALKQHIHTRVMGLGDVLLEEPAARLLETPGLDAVLLNFVCPDVLAWLAGPAGTVVPNVVYCHPQTGKPVVGALTRMQGEFRVPCPRHDLFPLAQYRFPFSIAAPMSVVLTDYGCPYACTFCVMPSLGFAARPLEDVLEELRALKRLGVREIFFIDQTFGVKAERTLELCRAMSAPGLRFSWSCFSRGDVTTPELLRAMAQAGCHTIIYGVESGSAAVLAAYKKNAEPSVLLGALKECRGAGIRTAATFILGLPGETEAEARQTIRLALEWPLDFAAFNVAIPRANTPLRALAIKQGLIPQTTYGMDQSGVVSAMGTSELKAETILNLRREANRCFYLRPGYLWRRLTTLRSWWDFKTQLIDGWGVVWDALRGKRA
jgi:hypothetical protein